MLKDIDISHYDTVTDFRKVKEQIDFIILKLGNIGDNKKFWLDDKFEYYYNECKKYNIPIGVYVYCYSNTPDNARIGGELVREYLNDKELELPVYIDIEDEELTNETKKTITDIIIAFNTEIEKGGNWAGFYCNQYWLNNKMNKVTLFDKYTNWIAIYPKTIDFEKMKNKYDIWQCTENGKINGINGNVDINIMYRDILNQIGKYTEKPIEENNNYYPKCSSNQKSLADGLFDIGVNGSYANRCLIAQSNGIYNYVGNYNQNMYLLELLKRGELKK